jgi:urea transport system ATP-binding protein
MMDVITGKTRPDEGTAFYDETYDLTRLDESRIANLGVGRKFQKPTVFENLTVFENMDLARKADRRTARTLFAKLLGRERDQIAETLDMIGLGERWHDLAGALSHGQKQWLEIGMLLVQDAQLLLLDEPVAGMTDHETAETGALIRRLAGERTVLVVEHDMEFVRALDTNVTVLHEGSVLAEGTLAQVQEHPRVIDVYLGR